MVTLSLVLGGLALFLALSVAERHLVRHETRRAHPDVVDGQVLRARLGGQLAAVVGSLGGVLVPRTGCAQPTCQGCTATVFGTAHLLVATARNLVKICADTSLELDARRVLELAERAAAAQHNGANEQAIRDYFAAAQPEVRAAQGGAN